MTRVSDDKVAVQRNNRLRAAFILKGTSFNAWCVENEIDPHNARKAVLGHWQGPKATKLVERIERAANAETA